MNLNNTIVYIFSIFLLACGGNQKKAGKSLVSVQSIYKKLKAGKHVQLIDMRSEEEYHHSHIPGACNIYRSELTDFYHEIEGMKMRRDDLAELLGEKGLSSKDSIFIYDAKGNVDAARLWWMLRFYGFENVALIDGGFIQWRMNAYPEVEGFENIDEQKFSLKNELNRSIIATMEDVRSGKFEQIIDARSKEEYEGTVTKNGAFRGGHIPGAVRFDYIDMIMGGEMTLKKKDEILSLLQERGLNPENSTVIYCHSGVRSAMGLFVLKEIAGMENVANYDGSWIEWSGEEKLEVEL